MVQVEVLSSAGLKAEGADVVAVTSVEGVGIVRRVAVLPEVGVVGPIEHFIHSEVGNDHISLLEDEDKLPGAVEEVEDDQISEHVVYGQ